MDHPAANGVLQGTAKTIIAHSPSLGIKECFKWCHAFNNTLVKEKHHAWRSQKVSKMATDKTYKVTVPPEFPGDTTHLTGMSSTLSGEIPGPVLSWVEQGEKFWETGTSISCWTHTCITQLRFLSSSAAFLKLHRFMSPIKEVMNNCFLFLGESFFLDMNLVK